MNIYEYDKNLIKNSLTLEQLYSFLDDLGAAPQLQENMIINKTICHNGNSHKLYYYDNTKLSFGGHIPNQFIKRIDISFKVYIVCILGWNVEKVESVDACAC